MLVSRSVKGNSGRLRTNSVNFEVDFQANGVGL